MVTRFILIFLFSYSTLFAKIIIISDLDDTLKQSKGSFKLEALFQLLTARKVAPFIHLKNIFNDMEAQNRFYPGIEFFYVSTSIEKSWNAKKWLAENGFPEGVVIQRPMPLKIVEGEGKESKTKIKVKAKNYRERFKELAQIVEGKDFKFNKITEILKPYLKDQENHTFFFFGDNTQGDETSYLRVVNHLNLTNARIFVRDVVVNATYFTFDIPTFRYDRVEYFLSERDLISDLIQFPFVSFETEFLIYLDYKAKKIVPQYIQNGLTFQIQHKFCEKLQTGKKSVCFNEMKQRAFTVWQDYYLKY